MESKYIYWYGGGCDKGLIRSVALCGGCVVVVLYIEIGTTLGRPQFLKLSKRSTKF